MNKLPIPDAALSQHVIVLGKTRSGKSSKLRVLVEEPERGVVKASEVLFQ